MTIANILQWLAAALLGLGGLLNLRRAGSLADPLKAKNRRTSGWLLLAAGGLFAVAAAISTAS